MSSPLIQIVNDVLKYVFFGQRFFDLDLTYFLLMANIFLIKPGLKPIKYHNMFVPFIFEIYLNISIEVTQFFHISSNISLSLEMALTRPDLSILLTHSKYGADLHLTWVNFDPTRFF